MQIDVDDVYVTLQGVQRIYLHGEAHIGAVISDDTGHYVLGPLVQDRIKESPAVSLKYAMPGPGTQPAGVPTYTSMTDEDFEYVMTVLGKLADQLHLVVRRGIDY